MISSSRKISSARFQWLRVTRESFLLLLITLLLTCSAGCSNWNSTPNELPDIKKSSSWWDPNKQEIRTPSVEVLPSADDYLVERSALPNNPVVSSSWNPFTWLWNLFNLSSLVLIGGLILLVAIILVVITQLRRPVLEMRSVRSQEAQVIQREAAKIAELPFELEVSDEGFLATAKKHAREGSYDKAIVYLFSHVLVDLDHRKFITLRRGKTNRMLMRELKPHVRITKEFQFLVLAFERVFFGRHQLTAAEFEECLKCCEVIGSEPNPGDMPNPIGRAVSLAMIALPLVFFAGCQKAPSEEYGVLQNDESESLAGFNVLQQLFADTGRRTVRVDRLSPRLRKFGTIVWAPDSYSPPTPSQCAWIENWLSENEGSTFIYVGRDYVPGADYWLKTSQGVAQPMRLPYLKQVAKSISNDDSDVIKRSAQVSQFSRWFIRQPSSSVVPTETKIFAQPGMTDQQLNCELKTRGLLVPLTDFSTPELQAKYAKELRAQIDSDIDVEVTLLEEREESQGSRDDEFDYELSEEDENDIIIKEFAQERYAAKQQLKKQQHLVPTTPAANTINHDDVLDEIAADRLSELDMQPLYSTSDGTPLIYEIASESWSDSKLIVINNASLCCNYCLVDTDRRSVAMSIIKRTRERGRAAFLSISDPILRYSSPPSNDPFGLALFTIYPLNIILIHCLIFGIGALIVMWPIFGRPQTIPETNATDFGRHIEAFGALLRRTKDRVYALHLIGRYHREVKKDITSEWSNMDEASVAERNPT